MARLLLAGLLCLGLLTPLAAAALAVALLAQVFVSGSTDWRTVTLLTVDGWALAFLGPGAYSVDARIFGRRLLVWPPDRAP